MLKKIIRALTIKPGQTWVNNNGDEVTIELKGTELIAQTKDRGGYALTKYGNLVYNMKPGFELNKQVK